MKKLQVITIQKPSLDDDYPSLQEATPSSVNMFLVEAAYSGQLVSMVEDNINEIVITRTWDADSYQEFVQLADYQPGVKAIESVGWKIISNEVSDIVE